MIQVQTSVGTLTINLRGDFINIHYDVATVRDVPHRATAVVQLKNGEWVINESNDNLYIRRSDCSIAGNTAKNTILNAMKTTVAKWIKNNPALINGARYNQLIDVRDAKRDTVQRLKKELEQAEQEEQEAAKAVSEFPFPF